MEMRSKVRVEDHDLIALSIAEIGNGV